MLERLLTEARVLWFYLFLIFVPLPEYLGFYHDDLAISHGFDPATIAALGGIGLLIAAMFALRNRVPVISFGIAWFFAAHALESSFIGLELVFEHRNYLALFGPALVLGCGLEHATRAVFASRLLRRIALVAPLVLLSALTWSQVQRWSSIHDFLASHALSKPDSARANAELASYYANVGEWDRVDTYLERFEALLPDDAGAPLMRIHLSCRAESIDDTAIHAAVEQINAAPYLGHLAQKLTLLSRQWARPNECPGLAAGQLLRLLEAALARQEMSALPDIAANLHGFEGLVLRREGRHEAALQAFRQGVAMKPTDVDLLLFQAYTELTLHRYDELARTIERVRSIDSRTIRYSGRKARDLESSFSQARELDQRLPELGKACAQGKWPADQFDRIAVLLASSDTVWIVLPAVESLIATVVEGACDPPPDKDSLTLIEMMQNNPNLPQYLPGRFRLRVLEARILNSRKRSAEALEKYRQAVDMVPDDFQALYEMAYLELNNGEIGSARNTARNMRALESATEPGNDSRLIELEGYIDSASQ
jgi:tetratricopeptide (TPR) repeat protein